MKTIQILTLALAALVILPVLGCNARGVEVDQNYVKKSTENAQLARGLFDAKKGDWAALSQDEIKQLSNAYGSLKAAETVWKSMAAPPAGGISPQN